MSNLVTDAGKRKIIQDLIVKQSNTGKPKAAPQFIFGKLKTIPGHQLIGSGYNLLKNIPANDVIDHKKAKSHITYKNPKNTHTKFAVPSTLKLTNSKFDVQDSFEIYKTKKEYENALINKLQLEGVVPRSIVNKYDDIKVWAADVEKEISTISIHTKTVQWYTLSVSSLVKESPANYITDEFGKALVEIKDLSFEENKEKYFELINNFGTHIVTSGNLGGYLKQTITIDSADYSKMEISDFSDTVIEKVMKNANYKFQDDEDIEETLKGLSKHVVEWVGGSKPTKGNAWDNFIKSLIENPTVLLPRYEPIYEYACCDKVKAELKKAIDAYLKQ